MKFLFLGWGGGNTYLLILDSQNPVLRMTPKWCLGLVGSVHSACREDSGKEAWFFFPSII